MMTENPTLKVQINGHTDNVGKPADNLKLSANRAKSVVDYLVSKGINTNRLQFKGFGETKPIADNKTEAGRALKQENRICGYRTISRTGICRILGIMRRKRV